MGHSTEMITGGMTDWKEIACGRGCEHHAIETVHVQLGGPTAYHDYPPIPWSSACEFDMNIWAPVEMTAGPYCPAVDTVSMTIRDLGVWEPSETTIILDLLKSHPTNAFVDIGAHIGWFSILAQIHDVAVFAWEADPEVAAVLRMNLGFYEAAEVVNMDRIGPMTEPWKWGYRKKDAAHLTVKMDIEGAEPHAVQMLDFPIEHELVDFMLIELSPVFHDGYPDMVRELFERGFIMGQIPDKSTPPAKLTSIADLLWHERSDSAAGWVGAQHQTNCLFARPELVP